MPSISIDLLLTILFTEIDDWYKVHGDTYCKRTTGCPPKFSDSEIMTLMIAEDFIPYPAESQYVEYIRANHLALFPNLLSQSQFNRRVRHLARAVEMMRRSWLVTVGVGMEETYLIDTKPLPVVGYKRSKRHSHFLGSASYGYCASRKMHYFGYKLVVITTLDGIAVVYDFVPANIDERKAAEAIIDQIEGAQIIGDKGFLGKEWKERIAETTGNQVITPKRKNQLIQHPAGYEKELNRVRERIEGVFNELQNTGRNLERLLAKTISGLSARVVSKLGSHLMKYILGVKVAKLSRGARSRHIFSKASRHMH